MTSALQNEAEWLPHELDELPAALKRLRERLTDAGRSPAEVQGITGWIVGKALGERDTTNASTRARYRRILREVGVSDPTDDPKRRSRPHRAPSGPPLMHAASTRVTTRRDLVAQVLAELDELDEAV